MPSSTHKTLCEGVVTGIVALALTDYPNSNTIGSDRVLNRWGIEVEPVKLPAIFVTPVGTITQEGGTNERDDWVYPVSIYIVDRTPLSDPSSMDKALYWREQIAKKFISRRCPGVSASTHACVFNASPVLDEKIVQAFQLLTEPIFLAFKCREARV